jgi:NADH-quinone oxidoreductase subunit L
MEANLWLIPGLPLLASIITGFLGQRFLKQFSHWPTVISFALSTFLSITVLVHVAQYGAVQTSLYSWISIGSLNVSVNLQADALTAIMLAMVTFVSFLVAVFSKGYMQGDPGYYRYFTFVALFVFCMTMLVLSSNFLLTFVFWEGVGLCSYLLIGYWFSKRSASAAARKAFLVNRIGDFGFILGILTIWAAFGSLDYSYVFDVKNIANATNGYPEVLLTTICLLLTMGAIGKSAQFPLHVWLPDAMEGPTPVSALIHAATMVTAGVYLVARATPLFMYAPAAQVVVGVLGGLTAIIAALTALTQNDLKRVMAYSTVSQLGYMFMALGAGVGGTQLVTFAVIAAMFHLFTHAFFKALLFLGSGSVMHAMGNVIDIRRFGGLRKVLPVTHITFLFGAAALAGIPPFAGFFSKDEILTALQEAADGSINAGWFQALLILAMVTAGLTAFYTFRAYFITFWGETKIPPEAEGHAHEGDWWMKGPLIVLAIGALAVGYVMGPMTHAFANIVEHAQGLPQLHEAHPSPLVIYGSIALAIIGVVLAAYFYMIQPALPDHLASRMKNLYQLSLNKFYLDEIYNAFIVKPGEVIAALIRWIDANIVDGLVDLTGNAAQWIGRLFQPVQNGLVQFYALAMILGLAVFAVALVARLYAG